jgi:hypothetical protein
MGSQSCPVRSRCESVVSPLNAIWLDKARSLPQQQFKREVDKELTGRAKEPPELVCAELYNSQIPILEQALETAAPMLVSDMSRGYCLEMICAAFLVGANLDNGNPGSYSGR